MKNKSHRHTFRFEVRGWLSGSGACSFLRRTQKKAFPLQTEKQQTAFYSLIVLPASLSHTYCTFMQYLNLFVYGFMIFMHLWLYIVSTIFPRLYHGIISEWREMSSCLDIDSFLSTALHWSPLSYLITNIESLSLRERDGRKRWLSIRNAAPPRP